MQVVIDIDENVFTRLFDNGIEDYAIANDDLSAIAKSIRNGTPLDAMQKLENSSWVPCSERLPEDGDTYLVTIEYNGEVIGVDAASYSPVEGYIDKHWDTFNDWKEDDDSCYHVTAWMPLPKPY